MSDVIKGSYDLIFAHPEALFNTEGEKLLLDKAFQKLVLSVIADDCHTVESW